VTFSISARCPRTDMFGVAISSSSPAVAARCADARAQVGAACTQNITDPRLGPRLLDLIKAGSSAQHAIEQVVAESEWIAYRQLAVVDANGETATYSGEKTLGVHAAAEGPGVIAVGNLLADPSVPSAMVEAFTAVQQLPLAERLLAALAAGLEAGGEAGPVHSAGLLVVDRVPWPVTDLRIDWSSEPIRDLVALWRLWRPQMESYLIRALEPDRSPAYDVPGEQPSKSP
jgi:uncharacterized Ntn-hydrolase superfamily protein